MSCKTFRKHRLVRYLMVGRARVYAFDAWRREHTIMYYRSDWLPRVVAQ